MCSQRARLLECQQHLWLSVVRVAWDSALFFVPFDPHVTVCLKNQSRMSNVPAIEAQAIVTCSSHPSVWQASAGVCTEAKLPKRLRGSMCPKLDIVKHLRFLDVHDSDNGWRGRRRQCKLVPLITSESSGQRTWRMSNVQPCNEARHVNAGSHTLTVSAICRRKM